MSFYNGSKSTVPIHLKNNVTKATVNYEPSPQGSQITALSAQGGRDVKQQ